MCLRCHPKSKMITCVIICLKHQLETVRISRSQNREERNLKIERKEKKRDEQKEETKRKQEEVPHQIQVPTEPMTLHIGKVLSFKMEPILDDEQNVPKIYLHVNFCSKKFLSDANLLRHLKYAHKREQAKKLKEKELEQQENLRKEEEKNKALNDKRNKNKEKNKKKECSDVVSSQSDDGAGQKKKGKAAKGKRIKCVLCSKMFASRHTLNLHYDLTHIVKKYACDECVKVYQQKNTLQGHINMIHKGQRFKCTISGCSESFMWKDQLKFHILGHEGKYRIPLLQLWQRLQSQRELYCS